MLRQLRISQRPGEFERKWFGDDSLDLIVWFGDDRRIWGFQLCYDLGRGERAMTWTPPAGYAHNRVDDGEGNPLKNLTPILVPDGAFVADDILRRFADLSAGIDASVRDFVLEKLRGFPRTGA